ncbi:hypothetical protein EOE18_14665 [Novosphingobium umbonatum]|uniref:Uncharacterized protein n=1 Tax=Novosphingobium umbonatum TaxID=1908524 RepID=A0A437N1U6_9SPHN|nr:hypothetical protein [Novosphingobium umbonatum]RVU03811.1 hypothetical protein EOE18_14665 [Novosphingobium umbonatum]
MIRTGRAKPGYRVDGLLHWTYGGKPAGSISYAAIMDEPGKERLILSYNRGPEGQRESAEQIIPLCHTTPHYGGKRWWMICPYQKCRVGLLYKPPTGDRFASRKAWGIGYHIQRVSHRDRPFERLQALQKKLGLPQGWDEGFPRPKGMWQRTYEKHLERFCQLEAECGQSMMQVLNAIRGQLGQR